MGYKILKRGREVIFTAKIEYADRTKRKEPFPEPDALKERVRKVLEGELPDNIRTLFDGMDVKVEVKVIREGCFLVFFSAVFAVVGGYKGFYESAELLAEHARLLLRTDLESHVGDELRVIVYPRYYDSGLGRFVLGGRALRLTPGRIFLALLLLLCILESIFIISLVSPAIQKTYFPEAHNANQNTAPVR